MFVFDIWHPIEKSNQNIFLKLKKKMLDYDLIEQYQSYNIFIGDVLDPSEIKKQQKGMNNNYF